MLRRSFLIILAVLTGVAPASAQPGLGKPPRLTVSLDGIWDIDDSIGADQAPVTYRHTVAVPGLVHSSTPGFADVDKYRTKQLMSSLVYQGRLSQGEYDKLGDIRGTSQQTRNYFWYHKNFHGPAIRAVALLKVSKAQFGTVVYLNGVRIGEHLSCFTAGYFDVSKAIHWNGDNELVIRVGAHPGILPATVSGGTDFEKNRWTPGIYDSVSLIASDNPVIFAVQAAPRLATKTSATTAVLVQTELRNYRSRTVITQLNQRVLEWKSGRAASKLVMLSVSLAPNETRLVKQLLPVAQAHLWSTDDPFLYRIDTSTSGDAVQTRFGMREFRFDTPTKRAYLNGHPFFLRGTNIALHRFFEDPKSGTLPWNDAWVHRLLVDIPKQLHWNAMRFTIGPVPDRWLEMADENGLLIENEYPVWVGSPVYTQWRSSYDTKQMISEYGEWMRDDWNHPSVAIWDATNESWLPEFATKIIPAVRSLDLSNRPWENSYNDPANADDPVEDHNYFLEALSGSYDASSGGKQFELADLESMESVTANPFTKSGHAKILNEYGWMWLNRDGSPTLLTELLYKKLLGDKNTAENRWKLYARVIGGETELWRAYRNYAGVMHFSYLTQSEPNGFTSDNFVDISSLKLEPNFAAAMEQAFKPLGVYLNFWHPTLVPGDQRYYFIHMVNDEDRRRAGTLRLRFVGEDNVTAVSATTVRFAVAPLGSSSYSIPMKAPAAPGSYRIEAIAAADDNAADPTISTRDVAVRAVSVVK